MAKWRGVSSPMLVAFTLAPRWMSKVTKLRCPSLAAQCKGLNPWSSLWTITAWALCGFFQVYRKTWILPLIHVMFCIIQPNTYLHGIAFSTPVKNILHFRLESAEWLKTIFSSLSYNCVGWKVEKATNTFGSGVYTRENLFCFKLTTKTSEMLNSAQCK